MLVASVDRRVIELDEQQRARNHLPFVFVVVIVDLGAVLNFVVHLPKLALSVRLIQQKPCLPLSRENFINIGPRSNLRPDLGSPSQGASGPY